MRSVLASLVERVYVLEANRQKKREGEEALAPPWCDSFGFQLNSKLKDKYGSIFGAILECEPPTSSCNHSADRLHFVVAFRGTLVKEESFLEDIKLDFQLIWNKLHSSSRCKIAVQAVENLVATAGNSKVVWLAGHSLGSAIALEAGKTMAKKGVYLECLLFNPPYPSFPIEKIKNKTVKRICHLVKSGSRAAVAVFKRSPEQWKQSASSFAAMSPWVPQLFVNKDDYICLGYIGYFEHGKWMLKHGFENFHNFASQYSVRSMLSKSENGAHAEPLYLIPSANLTINSKPTKCCLSAHRLSQWWTQDQELESEVYKY